MAEHYNTAIVPARVRKPQDKSHAEGSVRFAETWIIASLRNQKFFAMGEVKEAVFEKLKELNERPFKNRAGTRYSAFVNEEKAYLMPLPACDFEPAAWSVAKVANDYLISDGKNRYSVPSNLIGERVDIRVTRNLVEIFYHGTQVALHKRLQAIQYAPVVKPEHMTPEHRSYLKYNADNFTEWATKIGTETLRIVQHFLAAGKVPEQGYKACASLMKLGERYGGQRLEAACKHLAEHGLTPSIRNLNSILKSGQDQPAGKAGASKRSDPMGHGFTRGAAYFRKDGDEKK